MPTAKQKTPENESEVIPGLFGMEARGSGSQACCTARLPPHGTCRSIAAASPASDGGQGQCSGEERYSAGRLPAGSGMALL